MRIQIILLVFVGLTAAGPIAFAQDTLLHRPKKERDETKPSLVPAPILFYEPETGIAGGANLIPVWRFGTDTATRKSNARVGGWYSQRQQLNLQLSHDIFTAGEKWLLYGDVFYWDYPIFFYGIGNDTDKDDESEISYKLFLINQRVFKGFGGGRFAGILYRYTSLRDVQADEPTVTEGDRPNIFLDENIVPARDKENNRVSGVGPTFIYDTRDNVLSTFTGNYVDVLALFNTKGLGSDYTFTRYQLDARHFQPLFGSTRTILAGQLIGQFHTGTVPFRELGYLGGINLLRGIYEGRFRDRQLVATQWEVRRELFWRINGAVFMGAGQVQPRLGDFRPGDFNLAGGAGFRFQFNRRDRLNVRLDYGIGSGNSSGLYFGLSEAF